MSKSAGVRSCVETRDGHFILRVWLYGHGEFVVPSLESHPVGGNVKVEHVNGAWRVAR